MSASGAGKRLKMTVLSLLSVLLGSYALWLLCACFIQRKVLFPIHAIASPAPEGELLPGLERHWLETAAGPVEWWFLPAVDASAGTPAPLVVHAHGNGELIDFQLETAEYYRELGFHVLLCEYRGYGRSAGAPSQAGIVEDHRKVLERVLEREDLDGSRVLYHGRSLGTGVVCALALQRAPRAMVLTSPFVSVANLMQGYLIPAPLVWDPFDNIGALEQLDLPVLVMHGDLDRVIPISHSRRLAAADASVELVELKGVGHNDIPTNTELVREPLRRFIEAKLGSS